MHNISVKKWKKGQNSSPINKIFSYSYVFACCFCFLHSFYNDFSIVCIITYESFYDFLLIHSRLPQHLSQLYSCLLTFRYKKLSVPYFFLTVMLQYAVVFFFSGNFVFITYTTHTHSELESWENLGKAENQHQNRLQCRVYQLFPLCMIFF